MGPTPCIGRRTRTGSCCREFATGDATSLLVNLAFLENKFSCHLSCTVLSWWSPLNIAQSVHNAHSGCFLHCIANAQGLTGCHCCCRWNTLAAPDVGLTLQLLPMLLGFFTYKAAVIAKTGLSLLESMSKESEQTTDQTAAPAEGSSSALGATYSQQILTK